MTSPLDAIPGGVVSLTADLRIVSANRGLAELVGRPVETLLGQSLDVILSAPSRILFQTHVYPALSADGRVEEVFLTLASETGEPTPVLLNAVRLEGGVDDDGAAYDALIVRIRARSRWESDLLAASQNLKRERVATQQLADDLARTAEQLTSRIADQERNREFRDAFIGVVSHELRTPITTIFGMSLLLQRRHREMAPDAVARHLGDIVAEADRLRWLAEDLLVLSRAEGTGIVLATEPIVVSRIVERAVKSEQERSPDHELVVAAPAGLPLVDGEDVYVEQVVRNYLSNATKYSPPGTVVDIGVTEEDGGVAVRVIDHGPGLIEEEPERLFDLFYRAKSAMAHKPGAGIGLFVCRELIRAMGGRVWAVPRTGGAEFGFWLPAASEEDMAD